MLPPCLPPPPPPPLRRLRPAAGFTLLELLVVVAVTGVAAAILFPPLQRASSATRVELASGEIVGALRLARSEAVKRRIHVAVRFEADGGDRWRFTLYRDGDGDGVRNADIRAGIDRQLGPPTRLAQLGAAVRFGFPTGLRPSDPGNPRRRLDRLDDPIRFNASELASFNPLGGSTPGSVYLTDGERTLHAVRVLDRTGRIRVLRYDRDDDRWW